MDWIGHDTSTMPAMSPTTPMNIVHPRDAMSRFATAAKNSITPWMIQKMPTTTGRIEIVTPRCRIKKTPTTIDTMPSSTHQIRCPSASCVKLATSRKIPLMTNSMPTSTATKITELEGSITTRMPSTRVIRPKASTQPHERPTAWSVSDGSLRVCATGAPLGRPRPGADDRTLRAAQRGVNPAAAASSRASRRR